MQVLYRSFITALVLLLSVVFSGITRSQSIYSGQVTDLKNHLPISGAEIRIQGWSQIATTGADGRFSLITGIGDVEEPTGFSVRASDEWLVCSSNSPVQVRIVNLLGQSIGITQNFTGDSRISLSTIPNGFYLLLAENKDGKNEYKFWKNNGEISLSGSKSNQKNALKSALIADTLVITKNDYYTQKYAYADARENFPLLKMSYDNSIDYFEELIRPEAFEMLEFNPSLYPFSEVKSLKLIYSLVDQKMYYSNSMKYSLHYDFCTNILGYNKGQIAFNQEQYNNNPNRLYILATLNHFTASGIYTLEFLPSDELTCEEIATVYNRVAATSFFGEQLRFYANSTQWSQCANVPIISSDELYAGQNYQPLNVQENYGFLKKVDKNELEKSYLGRHDIVLLNTIPGEIAVVAGIITTEFQTPLSHINVLSHNRGTPNMALRDGWSNPKLNNLIGKLVRLEVKLDSFSIREATLEEAQRFWAKKEPQIVHKLEIDTTTSGLIDLTNADVTWVSTIGGKAANFAELTNVNVAGYGSLPLPENYFAIPFYYYWQHMKQNGLDVFVKNMLNDPQFQADINFRKQKLDDLSLAIKSVPLDAGLLEMVKSKLINSEGFTEFRFRSSTNAEDIDGFNGAGLYESYTGSLSNKDKPIDKAIKKVWASLWDFGAFEERDYFKIDHRSIAMGVLVHRSYPSEAANGVAITENIYNPYFPAITINVQVGEISVVNPDENYLPDQILYYTRTGGGIIEYINHSNVPGMEGKTVMTDAELDELKAYCMAIHNHYCQLNLECNPIDIEFKVDLVYGKRKLYIKQARLY